MLNWSSPPWVRFLGATPRTLPERCPARTDRSLRWLPMACCIYRPALVGTFSPLGLAPRFPYSRLHH
jgi:hypothetical protein